MPRVCLQFVIVVFPDHIHLLFLYDIEAYGILARQIYLSPLVAYAAIRSKAILYFDCSLLFYYKKRKNKG